MGNNWYSFVLYAMYTFYGDQYKLGGVMRRVWVAKYGSNPGRANQKEPCQ